MQCNFFGSKNLRIPVLFVIQPTILLGTTTFRGWVVRESATYSRQWKKQASRRWFPAFHTKTALLSCLSLSRSEPKLETGNTWRLVPGLNRPLVYSSCMLEWGWPLCSVQLQSDLPERCLSYMPNIYLVPFTFPIYGHSLRRRVTINHFMRLRVWSGRWKLWLRASGISIKYLSTFLSLFSRAPGLMCSLIYLS